MTDDLVTRTHKLRDEMAQKSRLLIERSRRTNHNGNIGAEAAAEAREAAGLDSLPTPPTPKPEPEPTIGPGDGGARGCVPVTPGNDAAGLQQRITQAEQAGDPAGAFVAKNELLRLRNRELNEPNQ